MCVCVCGVCVCVCERCTAFIHIECRRIKKLVFFKLVLTRFAGYLNADFIEKG